MTDFKIEKDVPFPKGSNRKYPFNEMRVGDSFVVTDPTMMQRVITAAANFGKNHNKKFATQLVNDGRRVWRIK